MANYLRLAGRTVVVATVVVAGAAVTLGGMTAIRTSSVINEKDKLNKDCLFGRSEADKLNIGYLVLTKQEKLLADKLRTEHDRCFDEFVGRGIWSTKRNTLMVCECLAQDFDRLVKDKSAGDRKYCISSSVFISGISGIAEGESKLTSDEVRL